MDTQELRNRLKNIYITQMKGSGLVGGRLTKEQTAYKRKIERDILQVLNMIRQIENNFGVENFRNRQGNTKYDINARIRNPNTQRLYKVGSNTDRKIRGGSLASEEYDDYITINNPNELRNYYNKLNEEQQNYDEYLFPDLDY